MKRIKNLRLVNCIEEGQFVFDPDGLANPNNNLLIMGDISRSALYGIDIDYYQFQTKNGIRTMETLASHAIDLSIATEQEKDKDNKFKYVYVFGSVCGENYMVGRVKPDDEFAKHALRVFRGFWASGAKILS